MTRLAVCVVATAVVVGAIPAPGYGQTPVTPGTVVDAPPGEPAHPGGAKRFVRDVAADYRNHLTLRTLKWYGVGGVVAVATHAVDASFDERSQGAPTLEGAREFGALSAQFPLAIGWWVTGHFIHDARAADAGRDLVRSQISAVSWTYAFKFAADRTRPNGEPRSFPSGHASATFATAMVLKDHYGWWVGAPAFAAAAYTAASRVVAHKHWASDVMYGAFVGMASARTVTLHLRGASVGIAPLALGGGAGVQLSIVGYGS